MGLLWKFMGASWLFNVFTGAAEMLGASYLELEDLLDPSDIAEMSAADE